MEQNQSGLPKSTKFPLGFFWGAATASHQVEGGNVNDWSQWEKKNAERLSHGSGFPISNHISGKAANHYELYEQDLDLAKSLNHNSFRFSIEWSRIESSKGQFNEKEINHYRDIVEACQKRGIEPFVTLWHWTHPIWFRDEGGWENPLSVRYYLNYIQKIVTSLPNVKYWITLNEPGVYINKAYRQGDWPPQKRGLLRYLKITNTFIKAHQQAYQIIKLINQESQVGVANHLTYFEGFKPLVKPASWWANDHFIKKIKNHQDFIGLNYYFHVRLISKNKGKRFSDMGWELFPEGLYKVLIHLKKYNKPIIITEHGLADAKDQDRAWYIEESLKWAQKAISDGVDLRGYLHWSLLDNFEWCDGFWPRFGLIEVDYINNFKRTVRPSAHHYSSLIKKYSID